ncbi:hypothetical protein PENTCL1PPCAC_10984, partial [Pristionchus entomophagus]
NDHKCPHCWDQFESSPTLKNHLRDIHGLKPNECAMCGQKFDRLPELTTHKRNHCNIIPAEHRKSTLIAIPLFASSSLMEPKDEPIDVSHSGLNNNEISALAFVDDEMTFEEKFMKEVEKEESGRRRRVIPHVFGDDLSDHICSICNREFDSRPGLFKHIQVKHMKSRRRKTIKAHNVKQAGNKGVKCPHCPSVLSSIYLIIPHLHNVHNIHPFDYRLVERSSTRRDNKLNTGRRPATCRQQQG